MAFRTTAEKMKVDRLSNIRSSPTEREKFGKFVRPNKTFELWNIACTNDLASVKELIKKEQEHLSDFFYKQFDELVERNEGAEKEIKFILHWCEEELEKLYQDYVKQK